MPIFTSKSFKITKQHFFKIFDVNAYTLKLTLVGVILLYIYCFIFPVQSISYFSSLQQQYSLQGIDNLFDYTIPLLAALLICYVFFQDYKDQVYVLFQFYSETKFNLFIFYKWSFYVSIIVLSSLLCSMFYYRNIAFLNFDSLLLAVRFIPNILFLCSLTLLTTVLFKNSYVGLFIMLTYFAGDFLSDARLFKFLSLGANANNFYYTISPNYYFLNRALLLILSILFIYLSCKKKFHFKYFMKLK